MSRRVGRALSATLLLCLCGLTERFDVMGELERAGADTSAENARGDTAEAVLLEARSSGGDDWD